MLQPATFEEAGFEGLWTPVMNFNIGHCQLKCTLCSEVCPTGAIRTITVEEKLGKGEFAEEGPISLGTAFFDTGRCLPHAMEIPCVVCEEVCPVSPKAIQTKDEEVKQRLRRDRRAEQAVHGARTCASAAASARMNARSPIRGRSTSRRWASRAPRERQLLLNKRSAARRVNDDDRSEEIAGGKDSMKQREGHVEA